MTPPPRARIKTTPARLVTKAKALFRRASTSVTNSLDQTRRSRRASATDVHGNDDDASTIRATSSSTTTLPRRRRSISADPGPRVDVDRNAAPHTVGATLWPANSPLREASVIASAVEEVDRGSGGAEEDEGGLISRVIATDATDGSAAQDAACDPDPTLPAGDVSPTPAPTAEPTTTPPAAALDSTPRPLPGTLARTTPSSRTASLNSISSSSASPAASTTALRTSPPASFTTATTIRPGLLRASPSPTSTTRRPSSSPTPSTPTHDDSADFPSFTYISADDSVLFADDAHMTGSAVDSPLLAPIPPPPASDLSLNLTDDLIPTPPRASSLRPHAERVFPTLLRAASTAPPARVPFPSAYATSSTTSPPIRTTVPVAVLDPISPPRNPQLITVPAPPVPSTVELRTPTPNPLDEDIDDEYAPIRWASHLPPLPSSPAPSGGGPDVAHAAIELGQNSPISSPAAPVVVEGVEDRVEVLTAYYESKLADVARQYLTEVESVRRAKVDADRRATHAAMELESRAWREQALMASVERLEAEVAALRSPSGSVAETETSASEADADNDDEAAADEDDPDSALTTAVSSPALGAVTSPKSALATPSKPKKPKKVSFSVKSLVDQLERTSAQLEAAEHAIAALADDNARLARFVGGQTEVPVWSAQEWRVVTEAMLDMDALVARVERGVAEIAEMEEIEGVKGRVPNVVDEYVQVLEGAAALANWLHAVHAAAARIAPAIAHHLTHLQHHPTSAVPNTAKSPTPPDSPENAHAHPTGGEEDDSAMDHVLDWLAHAAAWARLTARHAAWMVRMAAPGAVVGMDPGQAGDAVTAAGWRVGGEWSIAAPAAVVRGGSAGSVF
ncbi:hypothetical protein AMAG_00102 [Allomyces macrogynus ATCC 38327]|uniref:Uncharacterized protein n=1 Tax=Allomyces macrogynus (strain ATCC 38327) TaxID=578462 RepID=A0A0L0RVJ4_ALLM3|nr:hypothetical protein AMAG_00102 [Allomyces macrogynus ATCC 38327]|eukprot:KNE54100.1 hypothetical protein AMAG_00102 [Allomyces macrogynus ATCC 38327]